MCLYAFAKAPKIGMGAKCIEVISPKNIKKFARTKAGAGFKTAHSSINIDYTLIVTVGIIMKIEPVFLGKPLHPIKESA